MESVVIPLLLARARFVHGASPAAISFDPSAKSSAAILSERNTSLSVTAGSWQSALSTVRHSSGKWYAEIVRSKYPGAVGRAAAGIATALPATYPGSDANSYAHLSDGYRANSGYSAFGSTWDAINDIIRIAVDFGAGNLWFGKNAVWMSGDPATGASPAFTGIPASAWALIGGANGASGESAVKLRQAPAMFAVPAGFSMWA